MVAMSDTHGVSVAARTVDGARWVMRGTQRFFGVVLLLAAGGLWLQPGALVDADVMLFKLAMSIALFVVAAGLLQSGRSERTVEVELDPGKAELRLVRVRRGARNEIVERVPFSAFGAVENHGHMVRIWDATGGYLAEVPLADPDTRSVLIRALGAAGKL